MSSMRAALPCDCALDLDLHAELTATIRTIDRKIAAESPGGGPRSRYRRRATSSNPGTAAPSS